MPEPATENPNDLPGPCDVQGCENYAENEADGFYFCTKHFNQIVFNDDGTVKDVF